MENKNTEIDLIELFIKIALYIKKYIWIFAVAIILAVVVSVIKKMNVKETYTSSMLLKVQNVNDEVINEKVINIYQKPEKKNYAELITRIINTADILNSNKNIDELAKRMQVDKNILENVISINANNKNLKGEPISDFVTITVTAKQTDVFSKIEKGLINYINTNTFIKEKYQNDSVFYTSIIKEIDKKIDEAESYDNFLLKEKLKLKLHKLNIVELVEGFYVPTPQSYCLKKALATNLLIFIFLSFLIIGAIFFNKKIKEYKKK